MQKYKDYIYEKYNRKVIEVEHGFIDYEKFDDGSIYIYTLYVVPEARNQGTGKLLEDMVVEEENPTVLFCDIDKDSNNWILALVQICKKADYKVYEDLKDKVVLYKEL
jgi:GNAT superfamily N-acetyltransferase